MNWRHVFMLLVLALAAYVPTLNLGFIWDDHVIIEANTTLEHWSWHSVVQNFTSDNAMGTGDKYYRPVQALMDRVDRTVWGLRPFGFHLTNLLFHFANILLLYLLWIRLGYEPLVAMLACALFAVHPIDVEEFIVVSGRCTQISLCFMLATLLLAMKRGWPSAAGALLCYTLALFTKEHAVITGGWLALIFFIRGEARKRYLLLIPMALLTVLYLGVRHHMVHHWAGPMEGSLLRLFMLKVYPRVMFHYVSLLVWPWNLHNHRLIPHLTHAWPVYGLMVIALIAAVIRSKNKTGIFCLFWFLIWFLPTIPVMINGSFMLDHWGYGAAPSLFLLMSLGVVRAWKSKNNVWRHAAGGLYFTYVIILALLVHLNVALRGSDEKIYRWALNFTTSYPIKYNLGIHLLQTGRPEEGVDYLEEVLEAYPENQQAAQALRLGYATIRTQHRALRQESTSSGVPAP